MAQKYKIDLHTHSILSYDGGLRLSDYESLIDRGLLDYIAVTDHNEVTLALEVKEQLGNRIIAGEEIATSEGEVIGLFLTKKVPPKMTFKETAVAIHAQGGLVYVPHPFETRRSSIRNEIVRGQEESFDIVEVFNARGFLRGKPDEALSFATTHNLACAASSDAHCMPGAGSAFVIIDAIPTKRSLVGLLREGKLERKFAPILSFLCPAINKLKKRFL